MANSKSVWIINQYASNPEVGLGGRHYYFGKELAMRGYRVHLIGASFHHLLHKCPNFKGNTSVNELEKNFFSVWVKVPKYRSPHSLRRVLNWFIFAWKILFLSKKIPVPNTIICSSPSLVPLLSALILSKIFKSKIIFEVRDIWPLSLTELGSIHKLNPLVLFMNLIEYLGVKYSDLVISNLQGAHIHFERKGMDPDKFRWIPNGVQLNKGQSHNIHKELLDLREKLIIGYIGTIGVANNVEILIESAMELERDNSIHFVIVGEGHCKDHLVNLSKNLKNVTFLSSVPKKYVNEIIKNYDVCFIGTQQKKIYQYGISPNKMAEFMLMKKPILMAGNIGFNQIDKYNCGLSVEPNGRAIAEAIQKFKQMGASRLEEMGKNGWRYASQELNYRSLTNRLEQVIKDA